MIDRSILTRDTVAVQALALRLTADRLEHGEAGVAQTIVFGRLPFQVETGQAT